MILGHKTILQEILSKKIVCEPFNPTKVGPNSIDVHLSPIVKLVLPNSRKDGFDCIDVRKPSKSRIHNLETDGELLIFPGQLWLGLTVEAVGSDFYVPHMHGCSTNGRSGIVPHIEAGAGDIGFKSRWVCEIMTMAECAILFNGMRIAQIEFVDVSSHDYLYGRDCGRYAVQNEPVGGKI